MSKHFRYWIRCTTVATLVVLITFHPVWAGRGLRGLLKKRKCKSEPVCCEPAEPICQPVCCEEPAAQACCEPTPCCDAPPASDCCGIVVDSAPMESHSPSAPMTQSAPAEPAPAQTADTAPVESEPAISAAPSETDSPGDSSPSDTPATELWPETDSLSAEPAPTPAEPARLQPSQRHWTICSERSQHNRASTNRASTNRASTNSR